MNTLPIIHQDILSTTHVCLYRLSPKISNNPTLTLGISTALSYHPRKTRVLRPASLLRREVVRRGTREVQASPGCAAARAGLPRNYLGSITPCDDHTIIPNGTPSTLRGALTAGYPDPFLLIRVNRRVAECIGRTSSLAYCIAASWLLQVRDLSETWHTGSYMSYELRSCSMAVAHESLVHGGTRPPYPHCSPP